MIADSHSVSREPASRICGVYLIVNRVNGRVYVGSSKNIKKRWRSHKELLRRGNHYNSKLQRDWEEFKENSFDFILFECPPSELLTYEYALTKFYIDGYNEVHYVRPGRRARGGESIDYDRANKLFLKMNGYEDAEIENIIRVCQ